jgi:hypothetical protein
MDSKQTKTGKNRNKLTTNEQVTDMSLALWECSDHLTAVVMRTNLNSYCRDRLGRLIQRLQKEGVQLGNDLRPANPTAFETIHSTNLVARQLGLLD